MDYNFPSPIKSEQDLNYYENYLNKQDTALSCDIKSRNKYHMTVEDSKTKTALKDAMNMENMPSYLSGMIGKLVKVESLIGGRLESRIGKLMSVGNGYIVLKLNCRGCSTLICELSCVKYITVSHDNSALF